MMHGAMRLMVLRAFPLVKGYGANLAVKCDGQQQLQSVRGARSATMARKRGRRRFQPFLHVMGAPGDRNLVDFYFDTGLTYKAHSGERTTRSASASPRHGSATRSARDADTTGQSLASPLSSGVARMLNNNYSLCAALDQSLARKRGRRGS